MSHTTTAGWETRFQQTRLQKEGGSSFECSDYEGICDDMRAFIVRELSKQLDELLADVFHEIIGEDEIKSSLVEIEPGKRPTDYEYKLGLIARDALRAEQSAQLSQLRTKYRKAE